MKLSRLFLKPLPVPVMERFSTSLLAFGLLAGCAAAPPPPMAADNPANPSAPEAAVRPLHNTLETDSLTRKSRQILAQSAKEQQHWDQDGPASGERQEHGMKNLPGSPPIQDRASPSPTAPPQPMPGMAMPPE
jgi:hypothetical protein